jgi:hypothetical protein
VTRRSSAGCARRRSQTLAPRRFCFVGCKASPPQATPGVDLDALSEAELELLHAGLVKLASMDDTVLAALVEQVMPGEELASSS